MLWLSACAPDPAPSPTPPRCETEARGTVERLAPVLPDGSEGVAVWEGELVVSVPDGVLRLEGDTTSRLATLEAALGLAPGADGLWIADPGPAFTFDGSGDDGAVWLLEAGGAPREVAAGLANPNAVVVAPWGEVLVSDDTRTEIVAVDPGSGAIRTWLDPIPSPNGLAFSADGRWLYVASTFVAEPPLWRVPVDAEGRPGEPELVVTFPTGSTPDGVAVDAEGQVWVALNLAGELVRVDPETGAVEVVARGLPTPASLAFGQGPELDPCAVYVTELYGEGVSVVAAGVTGALP